MVPTLKQMTEYFRELGAADVPHTKNSYIAHAAGVFHDMQKWTDDEEIWRAAMFHSIYGTELFQRFALPLEKREQVRQFIGERAERLAYWNCCMDRATFDRSVANPDEPPCITDRLTGETIYPSADDFTELMRIHLCDFVEQVGRSQMWDYRRQAYRQIAQRLGGIALESYQRVFAQAPLAG